MPTMSLFDNWLERLAACVPAVVHNIIMNKRVKIVNVYRTTIFYCLKLTSETLWRWNFYAQMHRRDRLTYFTYYVNHWRWQMNYEYCRMTYTIEWIIRVKNTLLLLSIIIIMKTMKRYAANPAPIFFLIIMTSKSWHF